MKSLVPNAITVLRLALIPVFAWALLAGRATLAPALLVAIAASDGLDGLLARRWHAESRFGAVVDPVADKLTQLTGLVLLALAPAESFTAVPALFVVLVLARDLLLAYGTLRIHTGRGRVEIRPRFEGKASTVLVFALLLAACLGLPRTIVIGLALATAPLVIAAGVRYSLDGLRQARP